MMESQYSCPMCGEQFRPWKEQPGYVKSNKVLVMKQTTEGAPAYIPSISNHYIWPIVWTDTATTVLQNKFKAISARLDEELASMTDPKARMEYVLDSLNTRPPHTLFKKMDMPEEVRMRFDDKNQKSGGPKSQVELPAPVGA